ncbi:MAG TPA: cytochrome P450 [Acidimicrobiales bacterium]|nr:cytochrome P450 [Acidimicrobiales bacterium]
MSDTLPPGPRGPLNGLILFGPPFLRWCHRRYGDRFTVRLGRFGDYVYLVDPDDIRSVFHADDTLLHAGEANAPFLGRVLGPNSVLVTDEDVHRRQRRRMTGPFHGGSVARLVPRMAAIAAADVDTWPVGRPFAVHEHMRHVTLEVILQTVIGVTDESRLDQLRAALLDLTDIKMWMMAQFVFPGLSRFRPWRYLWDRKARADQLLIDEFERARQDPSLQERPDVLAMLVRHREEDETAMTDDELRDQIVTLLLAGHETTATWLSWALERLTRHPAVLAQATAAARAGDDAYLDAVVTETLRARPVVPDVSRRLMGDFELGQYRLPAGTFVDPAIVLVHGSERLHDRAGQFDPSRYVGARPDPAVWLPFGGGNRRCLGAAFAATEMRVVLAEILRRVDLEPTSAAPERARMRHVTLTPHRGGRVKVAQFVERVLVAGASPAPTAP